MTADSGRDHAHQVCVSCKAGKKKCDKLLPTCGLCARKRIRCEYLTKPASLQMSGRSGVGAFHDPFVASGFVSSLVLPAQPSALHASFYTRVQELIGATGRYLDEISIQYFNGIHRYLPILSRKLFQSNLIFLGAAPSADICALMLSMCLVTSSRDLEAPNKDETVNLSPETLHLATRSLLAQIQALISPSVYLVQAGLLLSVYEYARGRPDEALASISACARQAYAARINLRIGGSAEASCQQTRPSTTVNTQARPELHQAINTWWGLVLCERIIVCEVATPEQPLATTVPSVDDPLPIEPEVMDQRMPQSKSAFDRDSLHPSNSVQVGAFGRAAQATRFLDKVLTTLRLADIELRFTRLREIDTDVWELLGNLMRICHSPGGVLCEAIAIAIRTLFLIHIHICECPLGPVTLQNQSYTEWRKWSRSALTYARKIVRDIAEDHLGEKEAFLCQSVSPSYAYLVKVADLSDTAKRKWGHCVQEQIVEQERI